MGSEMCIRDSIRSARSIFSRSSFLAAPSAWVLEGRRLLVSWWDGRMVSWRSRRRARSASTRASISSSGRLRESCNVPLLFELVLQLDALDLDLALPLVVEDALVGLENARLFLGLRARRVARADAGQIPLHIAVGAAA